jgi:hypothetical protein
MLFHSSQDHLITMKTRVSARQCSPKTPQSMQTPYELHNSVIEVVEEQIAFGNFYLVGNQHSERSSQTLAVHTLPSNLIQKVNNNLTLIYPHTVEMFPHRIGKLFLALPAFLLTSSHRRRQFPDRGAREHELIVRLVKSRRCIQSIVVSIAMENRRMEGGPLELWLEC